MNDGQPEQEDNDPATGVDQPPGVDYRTRKRHFILMLLAYSAVLGVINCFVPEDPVLDFIFGLPLLILGVSWCFADAAECDFQIGGTMRIVLVVFFLVGFPIYLLRAHGLRGFVKMALASLLVIAMLASMLVTQFATAYSGVAIGLWEFVE